MTYQPVKKRWILPFQEVTNATTNPTAGRVYMFLVEVPNRVKVDAINVPCGAVTGNVRVGIYGPISNQASGGELPDTTSLIVESNSTALSSNTGSLITFTETKLQAGRYYIALQFDTAGDAIRVINNATFALGWMKYYDRSGGYGAFTTPCPTTANAITCPWGCLRVSG